MVRRDANEIKIPFLVLAFRDSISGSGVGDSPVCGEFGLVMAVQKRRDCVYRTRIRNSRRHKHTKYKLISYVSGEELHEN